jgi:hypothetical protein
VAERDWGLHRVQLVQAGHEDKRQDHRFQVRCFHKLHCLLRSFRMKKKKLHEKASLIEKSCMSNACGGSCTVLRFLHEAQNTLRLPALNGIGGLYVSQGWLLFRF